MSLKLFACGDVVNFKAKNDLKLRDRLNEDPHQRSGQALAHRPALERRDVIPTPYRSPTHVCCAAEGKSTQLEMKPGVSMAGQQAGSISEGRNSNY